VSDLENFTYFFNESQILQIYETFRNNDQIYSIAGDEDIQQAALNLITALEGFALHREASAIRIQYELSEPATETEDSYFDNAEAAYLAQTEMEADIARGK